MSKSPAQHLPTTAEEEIRAVELAAVHGVKATAEHLGIGLKTLEGWCYRKHRKQYSEFREGKISEWRAGFAAKMEDLAEQYGDAERVAAELALKQLQSGDLDAKELAALIKSMGSSRTAAAATGSKARGEPDHKDILEINFPQLEQAMEAMLEGAAARRALPVPNLAEE